MRRWGLRVGGLVQGVGFRPFVHRLARRFSLAGWVGNNAAGVELEVEGPAANLDAFLAALSQEAPPAAVIEELEQWELPLRGGRGFVIAASDAAGPPLAGVVPDLALCPDCLAELNDPADRRHGYPFINCTNCGPRYTIIEKIPYDRPHTTMRRFAMCPACRAEYDDPSSRRFHAQPNACPACGPRVTLERLGAGPRGYAAKPPAGPAAFPVGEGAVAEARRLLLAGGIVAVKGIGGFHLAVNAADDQAVARLRRRKGRQAKPLAVMVADLASARRLVELDESLARLLTSAARPIVVAPKAAASTAPPGLSVAPLVAPGNRFLGLMLAYAPIHHLLLNRELPVLVMTSANRSSEPICIDNREARRRLTGLADALLRHDRDIVRGNDDSVLMAGPDTPGRAGDKPRLDPLFLRRGRGYAPGLLPLDYHGPAILAVGAELKNTVCLVERGRAVVSQHLGDLQNLESYRFFTQTIADLSRLLAVAPQLVVHDLHPDYLSSRWARQWAAERGRPALAVAHHHAHLAACLAENRHSGPALGLILDGTGYGPDHTIWGGEILLGEAAGFGRYGHLETMPLPGGDLAVRQPWRTALGYLHRAFAGAVPDLPFLHQLAARPGPEQGRASKNETGKAMKGDEGLAGGGPDGQRAMVQAMLAQDLNCPPTSSCGRLFDAVAALAGGCREITYEAQAAIELMQAGRGLAPPALAYELHQSVGRDGEGRLIMGISPMIRDIAAAVAAGAGLAEISRRFHFSLVSMFTDALAMAAADTKVKVVALSGGVMQNEILLSGLLQSLPRAGLTVLLPRRLPLNDGCIAFGQAVVAAARPDFAGSRWGG